jgi:hypothetical protein
LIELELVAVVIEVFVQQDLLISVDPIRWSAGPMDGGWLMGFAGVLQDLVDGGGLGDGRSRHPASCGIRTSLQSSAIRRVLHDGQMPRPLHEKDKVVNVPRYGEAVIELTGISTLFGSVR